MLFKTLKGNHPFVILIIGIISSLLFASSFWGAMPSIKLSDSGMPLFDLIFSGINKNIVLSKFISLAFVTLQALLLVRLNSKFVFIKGRSYLPAFFYIIIVAGCVPFQVTLPVHIACVFLLFAIDRIIDSYRKNKVSSNLIDASLLLSIGSLFYFNLIFFMLPLWVSIVILMNFNIREWIITIVGAITPYLLLLGSYYLWSDLTTLLSVLKQNTNHVPLNIDDNRLLYIFFTTIAVVLLLSLLQLFGELGTRKISSRKILLLLNSFLLFAIGFVLIIPSVGIEAIYIIAIPASFIISNYFMSIRIVWIGKVLMFILILLLGIVQFNEFFYKVIPIF